MNHRLALFLPLVFAAGCEAEHVTVPPTTAPTKPALTRQLDASGFGTRDTVCGIVPEEVIAPFSPRERSPDVTVLERPQCWYLLPNLASIKVTVHLREDILGLAYTHPAPGKGTPPNFLRGFEVEGVPAARINYQLKEMAGYCRIVLGLSAESGLDVEVSNVGGCEEAERIAGAVVRRLPAKSG